MNEFLQSLRRVETATVVDEIRLPDETSLHKVRMDTIAVDDELWQKARELAGELD